MSFSPPDPAARRQARRQAATWAGEILADPTTLYIDTETTGLGSSAEIIDIAVIDHAGQAVFESLVRPDSRIPRDAIDVHGITDAMVATAPRWDAVYPEVRRLIDGRPIVVYNADYDFRLVNQMNTRFGFPRRYDTWQCAMERYSSWAGEWNARYGNFRWHKLEAALGSFGHRPSSHRALDDARACRLVVIGMAGTGA